MMDWCCYCGKQIMFDEKNLQAFGLTKDSFGNIVHVSCWEEIKNESE